MEVVLSDLMQRFPGLEARLTAEENRLTMPAFEVPRESRIVQAINRAYRTVRDSEQPTGAITPPGFYGTDAGHLYERAGMEGIVCGPGGRYNTMPDERVDIADYLDMIRIYLLTILEICEVA
jgi:acetylornithine deacetylase